MSYHTALNGPGNYCAVRWNGNGQYLEAMDQYGSWSGIMINTRDMGLPLPTDTQELLNWAREERNRKIKLKALREKYPTLDDALKHAEVIEALVDEFNE